MRNSKNSLFGRRSAASTLGLGLATCLIALSATSAEARHRHRHHRAHAARVHVSHHRAVVGYPGFVTGTAAIVVDANTGRTLYGVNEDALRHPASITKVMTLYMLFEQLEKGRLALDSDIPISAHAAAQSPSKLGLRPGSSIAVEDAIKAIVTKSANDIAVAVAEKIGGDEATFAEMMTSKAHALGMARTEYRNASGLPNPQQITTARDLTVLGRSIQERFPRYYRYFSTHQFTYNGATMRNHNHLLGRIDGMDGIKTGYTSASGFNLLTSVKRDGHAIVAVVLGGRTAGARDRQMAGLIETHIEAGSDRRQATQLAENTVIPERQIERHVEQAVERAPARAPVAAAPAPVGAPMQLAALAPAQAVERPRPAFIAGAPHHPGAVTLDQAEEAPAKKRIVLDGSTGSRAVTASMAGATTPSSTPTLMRWAQGAPAAPSPRPAVAAIQTAMVPPVRPAAEIGTASIKQTRAKGDAGHSEVAKTQDAEGRRPAVTGWMIQIGATDDFAKANDMLARARTTHNPALASAKPFTERVQKGETTLYRARFAGLDPDGAESACKALKRSGFACFTTRN